MTVVLTAAEQAEVLRQIALWPVCPRCGDGCVSGACVNGRVPGPIYLAVEGEPSEAFPTDGLVAPSRFVEATGPAWECIRSSPDGRCSSWNKVERERAELRVTCPNDCTRFDGKVPGHIYGSNWPWVSCQTCMGTMTVPFAHATVEVLPVVDYDDNQTRPIVLQWGSRSIYYDGEWERHLTLDPLPVPGRDWIVVLDGLVIA